MDTTTQNPTQSPQMDEQAVNLAKAIRQTESGGNFNAKGASGESGAYQWTPQTWKNQAQQILGDSNAQMTPQNQNAVAYGTIKTWKDSGLNAAQIAAKWNSGSEVGWENKIGVNSMGVKYNVPKYVKSVTDAYQTIKGGGSVGIDPNNPSSTAGTQMAPPANNPNMGGTPNAPASSSDNLGTGIMKGIENIPSSAMNVLGNLGNALLHPIKTAENLGNVAVGGAESGINALTGTNVTDQRTQDFGNVVNALKSRYGSLDALKQTAENDPVGLALDISTLVGGVGLAGDAIKGASLAGEAGKAGLTAEEAASLSANPEIAASGALGKGAQIGQNISNVAKAVNPINIVAKGAGKVMSGIGDFAGNTAKYALANEGGVQTSTIGQTLEHHEAVTPDAIAGANDSRTALGEEISQGLNAKLDALGETGSEYGDIRNRADSMGIDQNFLKDQIAKNTGLNFNPESGKFEFSSNAKVSNTTDINKINSFYKNWQPTFEDGQMTPNEFLNMRQQLQKISFNESGIGKSGDLENSANGIRVSLNNTYRDQIPGLAEKDSQFATQSAEFQKLKDGLFDKNNELKPSAITKIANATGKGKTELLARLEEISPGITEKIGIQKTLEDWKSAGEGIKVGTYGKAASIIGAIGTGALGGGAVGAIIGGMASTLLTSPAVLVPMLRGIGASSDMISSIMGKIGSASPLTMPELTLFANAVSKANAQKTPPTSAYQLPK